MTLWHKRLIMFFSRILGVIILIIAIALFLYYNYFFKKDNFVKYLPRDTAFYTTFKINKGLEKNQLFINTLDNFSDKYTLPDLDFSLVNPLVGYNVAFAIFPDESINWQYVFLVDLKSNNISEYKEYLESIGWDYQVIHYGKLERNILILSNTPEAIERIKMVIGQQESSLEQKINVVLSLKKLDLNSNAKIYLNTGLLNKNLDYINDERLSVILNSFENNKYEEIFLSLKINDQNIILKTDKFEQGEFNPRIIEKIPVDWQFSGKFDDFYKYYIDNIENLDKNNKLLADKIKSNVDYYEDNLKFNFEEDILSLFKNDIEIVENNKNDWMIASKIDKNANPSEISSDLERLIKEFVAFNNPIIEEKELPDGTFIKQIKKNTKIIDFKSENIANISLNYIDYNGNLYAYYIEDQVLYISNSKIMLENYLKNENLIDISEYNCNNNANFSQNIIFKTGINKYFDDIFEFVNIKYNKKGQIWLCLQ